MKAILWRDSFREVIVTTFEDTVDGVERIRFADPVFALGYLRRFMEEPMARSALLGVLGGADRVWEDALDDAAERLFSRSLFLYEIDTTEYFSDLPPEVGDDDDDNPESNDDEPVEPYSAKPGAKVDPPPRWELEATVDDEVEGRCFEGKTLHLRAKLVQGKSTSAEVVFVVFRDGNEVARHPSPPSGTVAFDLVLPAVADAETSWTVTFHFLDGADTYTGPTSYSVWPTLLHLRAVHFRTGSPVKGALFSVVQGTDTQQAETVDDGRVEHPLAKPEPFSVDTASPYILHAWDRTTGRRREARVERKYKAQFHNPKKPADAKPIEQFVNHVTADAGRDKKGSKVTVLVGAEGDADRDAASRIGAPGDVIFVKVLFTRRSKRNSPLPAVTGLSGATVVGDLTTGKVTLGPDATAKIELELGIAGGDTCEVSIGTTAATSDESLSFLNWRKLFYQTTRPTTMVLPSLARITASLEEVFVRYESYKDLAFTEAEAPPAGAWFDGPMMGLPAGRCVCIGDHNKTHFHARFDDQKNPIGVHVLLCHTQFDGGAVAHSSAVSEDVAASTHAKQPFPLGGGANEWVSSFDVTTSDGSANAFPKAIQDGNDAVRNATWTSPSGGGAIPADHVHVDWVNNRNVVTVKLPVAAAAAVDAGETVTVAYTLLWALGEFLGESDGVRPNLQLIADLSNDSMNDVMAHELGHTMKAVLKETPPGLAAGDHGWNYTGRGHQGPHCAFGAPAATFNNAALNLTGIAACKCIMYGENGKTASGSNGRFCEKCRPVLDATDIADITK